jgi:hypothetical protein
VFVCMCVLCKIMSSVGSCIYVVMLCYVSIDAHTHNLCMYIYMRTLL